MDQGSNSHQYLVLPVFSMSAILVESSDYLVVLFICISLITEAHNLLISIIAISISSLEKYQLAVFAQLLVGLFIFICASLMAQLVKNMPATRETWVRSLGWEDPLEKGKATYSDILAWRIPWTIQSMGSQRVRHN